MKRKVYSGILIAFIIALLTGCGLSTVDSMYCLPRRSDDQQELFTAINSAMVGLEYSAPKSGENQQNVQSADLNGDGIPEYLLFAGKVNEKSLQILIFKETEDGYFLAEAIDTAGYAFDRVEYVDIDGRPGMELVVGCQLSDQIVRSVSVYSFYNESAEQLLSTNYSRFLTFDLNGDQKAELVILNSSAAEEKNGSAQFYSFSDGIMERSQEAKMSAPIENMKRVMISSLADLTPALYVASTADETSLITDVFAVVDGAFCNVSLKNQSSTHISTLRNYFVYADDIDNDGIIELPDLIDMHSQRIDTPGELKQYLIRWYSMAPDGSQRNKMHTYHNFDGGWYVTIRELWIPNLEISQENGIYSFYFLDSNRQKQRLVSIYAFSGQDREEKAASHNRFILHRTESVLYAGELGAYAAKIGITESEITSSFHMIHHDWKTGET